MITSIIQGNKNNVIAVILIFILYSCNNNADESSSLHDTDVIVLPAAVDTDDHNKGVSSSIALDSAGKTIQPKDTLVRN
jgi:uncharacterized lipoprotein NlpE involved in copper resistance